MTGYGIQAVKLKDVKPGEWFTKKPLEYPNEDQVWIKEKGGYDRASKTYCITRWSDMNDQQWMKPTRIVYVGFTF